MSLKGFHVVFIISSIILLFGFSYWSFNQYTQNQQINHVLTMVTSLVVAIALMVYEVYFIKKVKE